MGDDVPEKSDCHEILTDYMKKDECDHEHFMMEEKMKEKEKNYQTIIKQSSDERKALWDGLDKVDGKVDKHIDKVNGKFDTITKLFIAVLLAICGSTIGMLYNQMNAKSELKTDMDKRFQVAFEGRAHHQSISEQNNTELTQVINKLDAINKKLEKVAR